MAFKRRNQNFSRSASTRKHSDEQAAIINKPLENPLEPVTLDEVSDVIKAAYERAGWAEIMPVQAHALPYLLAGRHMMVQSRTGSGKTGAYLVPLLEKIDADKKQTQALVLVPTRELAIQVEKEAKNLFGQSLTTLTLYGGVPYYKQLDALNKGVQLVIGTPGRILDHLQRGTLKLHTLSALIFDEADRMLSIGFYPDMKALQEYLPEKENMLVTLFSATYPHKVLELAKQFLNNPELLSLSQGQVHIATMQHSFTSCTKMDKDRILMRLLETENPSSSIIFCNTKATVHYVAQVLKGFGYSAEELSSELSQSKRENVLQRLRRGETRFVVATDVAARGIDIPMLSHVFLYEPPEDRESYIHRAGRTARANAAGTVISLVDAYEKRELNGIADFYEIELLEFPAPSDDEVARVVSQRVTALLAQEQRALNGLQKERVERFKALAKEFMQTEGEDNENVVFMAMLLDQVYQKSLNPMPENATGKGRDPRRNYPKSKREMEEKPLDSSDTLDSLRDAFQGEMRSKYGRQRGDRNAPWKHKQDNYGSRRDRDDNRGSFRREGREGREDRGGRGDYKPRERNFERDSFRSRDRNNEFQPRERSGERNEFQPRERNGERNGERNEFQPRERFERNNREDRGQRYERKPFGRDRVKKQSFNDDDVFRDSDNYTNEFAPKKASSNGGFYEFLSESSNRSPRSNREDRGFGDRNRENRNGRDRNFGDRNREGGRRPFMQKDRDGGERRPFGRDRDNNDSFEKKSFLPKRRDEEGSFTKFEDDGFMTPLRSKERKSYFGADKKDDDGARKKFKKAPRPRSKKGK